jgi:predicted NBD/HSP70 family sugar kinase
LRLDENLFHFIGVKFARSIVQIGVFNLAGLCLSTARAAHRQRRYDSAHHTAHAYHASDALLGTDPRIVAVGMAVPGPYLRTVGRTVLVSSMRAWRYVNSLA